MTTATATRVDPQDVALLDEMAKLAWKLDAGRKRGGIYDAALRRLHAAGYSVFPAMDSGEDGKLNSGSMEYFALNARMTQAAQGCQVAAAWMFWGGQEGRGWLTAPQILALRTFEEQFAVSEPDLVDRVRSGKRLSEREVAAAAPRVRAFVEANRDQIPPYPDDEN